MPGDKFQWLPQISGQEARLDALTEKIAELTSYSANDAKAQALLTDAGASLLLKENWSAAGAVTAIAANLPLIATGMIFNRELRFDKAEIDTIAKAHDPELTLAWMLTLKGEENPGNGAYRKLLVACPVDVDIYDSEGKLAARTVDGEATETSDYFGAYTYEDENGETVKVFILPPDEEYTVEISATGDGEMTYELREIDAVTGVTAKIVAYDNVPISKDEILSAFVALLTDKPVYPLKRDSGEDITPSRIVDNSEATLKEAAKDAREFLMGTLGMIRTNSTQPSGMPTDKQYYLINDFMSLFSAISAVERIILSDGDLHSAYDPAVHGSVEAWIAAIDDTLYAFEVSKKTGIGGAFTEDFKGKLQAEIERGLAVYYDSETKVKPTGTLPADVAAGEKFWTQDIFDYYQNSLGAAIAEYNNPNAEEEMIIFYTAVIAIITEQFTDDWVLIGIGV
jgi:hypothetical protein